MPGAGVVHLIKGWQQVELAFDHASILTDAERLLRRNPRRRGK